MQLVHIYTAFGRSAETVQFLEALKPTFRQHKDIGEQLFFSYVRENMTDK